MEGLSNVRTILNYRTCDPKRGWLFILGSVRPYKVSHSLYESETSPYCMNIYKHTENKYVM